MTSAKLVEWIGNERPRLPFRFRLRRSFAELLVSDLARSLEFWRDLCGFSIAYQRAEERFAYLDRPRSRIAVLILPWRGRIQFERGGGGRRSRA